MPGLFSLFYGVYFVRDWFKAVTLPRLTPPMVPSVVRPHPLLLNLSGLLHSGTFRPIRLGSTPGYLCMGRLHLCKFACRCVGVSAWDACTCISLRIDVWAYGGKRPLLSYGPFHIRAGSAIAGVMFVFALAMLEMARCGRAG